MKSIKIFPGFSGVFSRYCFYYCYCNPRKIILLIGASAALYSVLIYYCFCIKSDFHYKKPCHSAPQCFPLFLRFPFLPFGVPDELHHYLSSNLVMIAPGSIHRTCPCPRESHGRTDGLRPPSLRRPRRHTASRSTVGT